MGTGMTQPVFMKPIYKSNHQNKMLCGVLLRLGDRWQITKMEITNVVETHNPSEAFASVWGFGV